MCLRVGSVFNGGEQKKTLPVNNNKNVVKSLCLCKYNGSVFRGRKLGESVGWEDYRTKGQYVLPVGPPHWQIV